MAKDWELSIGAIAALGDRVDGKQIERDAPIVREFVDYIRWLADQDTSFPVTIGQLWGLYYDGVVECVDWSETCEALGLPIREDW